MRVTVTLAPMARISKRVKDLQEILDVLPYTYKGKCYEILTEAKKDLATAKAMAKYRRDAKKGLTTNAQI